MWLGGLRGTQLCMDLFRLLCLQAQGSALLQFLCLLARHQQTTALAEFCSHFARKYWHSSVPVGRGGVLAARGCHAVCWCRHRISSFPTSALSLSATSATHHHKVHTPPRHPEGLIHDMLWAGCSLVLRAQVTGRKFFGHGSIG